MASPFGKRNGGVAPAGRNPAGATLWTLGHMPVVQSVVNAKKTLFSRVAENDENTVGIGYLLP